MTITNCGKFKGEIENYLVNGQNNIDSKINNVFCSLKLKTWLCRTNIVKKDGYHTSHVLFILILLPMLRIKTVKGFCEKYWKQWSKSKKDTFYRFKQNASYRWRSFMYKVNVHIFKTLELDKTPQEERYFVIDVQRDAHENMRFISCFGSVQLCFSATWETVKPFDKSVFSGIANDGIFAKWIEIVCCSTPSRFAIRSWGW